MEMVINGLRVNYFEKGTDDQEEAVVMLHGWGSNISLFEAAAEFIALKYRVFAPDMPGFGETPEPPKAWNVDEYTDFIIEFIKKLGLKKVILLGHSFGGRVIIKLVNRKGLPFEVTRLILVDSAGIRPEKTKKQEKKEDLMKIGKKLLSFSPKLLSFLQSMTGSADYKAASPLMREILVNVVNEDLSHLLPSIKQEALLVWGTLDTATPIMDGELMEELIPEAGLARIEGAGHYSFLENAPLFNSIMESYLEI
ncbi:MAG: alpha/beta hydrolase [Ruminococcaceae bacterium]|nr:alpha/beta hydrolase [Oscillospiraceae bacterium]